MKYYLFFDRVYKRYILFDSKTSKYSYNESIKGVFYEMKSGFNHYSCLGLTEYLRIYVFLLKFNSEDLNFQDFKEKYPEILI